MFHGNRTFGGFADGNTLSCSILACTNHSLESCGTRFDAQTNNSNLINFTKIKISGYFPYDDDFFILPTALDTSIMPLKLSEFAYDESDTVDLDGWEKEFEIIRRSLNHILILRKPHRYISIDLIEPKADLLTFGIYGRDFRSSSYRITSSIVLIFLVLLIRYLFAN